ncbi:hypothetical protein HK101_006952, partial [Irineochytrium annulatum]
MTPSDWIGYAGSVGQDLLHTTVDFGSSLLRTAAEAGGTVARSAEETARHTMQMARDALGRNTKAGESGPLPSETVGGTK